MAKKKLQLTFDDGPQPDATALEPILKEIASRKVVAAFFVLGEEVKKAPASAKKITEAKHILANHSWDHLPKGVDKYTDAELVKQFTDTQTEVKKATGVEMKHWRAPRLELGKDKRLEKLLVGPGKLYKLSHNDIHADSKDSQGATTAEKMLTAIRADLAKHAGENARILFHVVPHTAAALKAVLDGLAKDGHAFVDFAQSQ